MKHRRAPVIVHALDEGFPEAEQENDPFFDIQLEKVLKELSFIRIRLDQIVLPEINTFIQKLHRFREFYGFQLEYSFPCLDVVSKSLKTTVRIPEKHVEPLKIEFNHRRIVLLDMHQDQVEQWQKAQLTIHLLVNMAVNGKHTTRPLAKCHVKLRELIFPPYIISRDFDFVGDEFQGTAAIRIDLGSRVKPLMETLDGLRKDRSLEDTFVVTPRHREGSGRMTKSRSSSRCRAHSSASHRRSEDEERTSRRPHSVTSSTPSTSTPAPAPMLRPPRIGGSTSSLGSDSVFVREPRVLEDPPPPPPPRERISRTVSDSYGASTVGDTVEEISRRGGKYYLEVTVHSAVGLPPVEDENGCLTSPSSYLSILGREGDLRSPVYPRSRDPQWNFTARFAISSERRNLVVKVHHRGVLRDTALGFVTIPLPTDMVQRSVYEMTDVTRMCTSQVPMLTISLNRVRNLSDADEEEYLRAPSYRSAHSPPPRFFAPPPRMESPPILESSQEIKEKMQRCMADLESMMRGINK